MAAEKSRVALLTENVKGARLRGDVRRHLTTSFPEHIEIISFKSYAEAARKHGVKGQKLWDRREVPKVAPSLALDYVVFLRPRVKRRKNKKKIRMMVVLLDLATGKTIGLGSQPIAGPRLSRAEAATLRDLIVAQIPAPKIEVIEIEEQIAPPVPVEVATAPKVETSLAPTPVVEEQSVVPALTDSPSEGGDSSEESPASRSSLWLNLGAFARYATVLGGESGYLTCYCGPDETRNPPFPGAGVAFTLFPLSSSKGWMGHLGLRGEVSLGELKTQIGTEEETSTVVLGEVGIVAGAPLRFLGRWSELEIGLGYRYFKFPLAQALFPGVILQGPVAGLALRHSIVPGVDVSLGGHWGVPLVASGGTVLLGELGDMGSLYRVESRVEFRLGTLLGTEVRVGGWIRADGMLTRFKGETSLRGESQGSDVELEDEVLSLGTMVGFTF